MLQSINSFDQIKIIGEKPLIICDIDETVITFSTGIDLCHKLTQEIVCLENDFNFNKEFTYIYKLYKLINPPVQTDPIGFSKLINKIDQIQGQLVFLTARNKSSIEKTRSDFEKSGLDYNYKPVYYTNNSISKGEYIKSNIKLDEYDQIIFIDDNFININTVINFIPQAYCYLFVYSK
jgi:acid phosphatase class B